MADERPDDDAEVTTQPSISTEEAEQTDVELSPVGDEKVEVVPDPPVLEVRDADQRIVRMRIVPWRTVIETNLGPEMFELGAFNDTIPSDVRLRMDHQDPPTGKGIAIEQLPDAGYLDARVAKTSRGDDQLALIAEGVSTGASVGFEEVPGGTSIEKVNGRRVRVHRRVRLREVSTTWRPAYEQAGVMYVRSNETNTEIAPMADQEAPVAGATQTSPTMPDTVSPEFMAQALTERLGELEERSRQNFAIPTQPTEPSHANRGEWMSAVVRMLSGERIPDMEMRALSDIVTTDNIGVVPDAYSTEIIGVIDPLRRFMSSTRRLETPTSGMGLVVPKIITRPTVATQAAEKDDIASNTTSITTVTYDAVTKAGGGDLSLQILKRSSPSFLSLYLELLAEAYAIEAEESAVEALLGETGVVDGGTIDPEALILGAAWQAGATVRKPPTTIWMSSAAVGAFIDAKASTTNAPLYSDLRADFTAAGGVGGSISGLRPVWVPALDAVDYEQADVIVGPSSGFGWAEDGTYTLQVDVPAKAGRDVAIVGILWFAPMYPTAFTRYVLAAS
jgi:HK97 family phage prohead protease/HK97 family phage major capsid protein